MSAVVDRALAPRVVTSAGALPAAAEVVLAALLAAGGFVLAVWLSWPGTVTHDALAVYDQAYSGQYGDWQPPLVGWLWRQAETVLGYGPQAIMLPTVAAYWLGLLLVFLGARTRNRGAAWLVLLVGFLPPTFVLLGIVWRDILFAAMWLLAFALAYLAPGRPLPLRALLTLGAVAIFVVACWVRPNALFAAVPLLAFLLWPARWRWWRMIAIAIPAVLVLQVSSDQLTRRVFHSVENHALHSLFVFDLDGILHFSGDNPFPVSSWTPAQVQHIRSSCYDPAYWDAFWWEGCEYAMQALNNDVPPGSKLFGSDTLRNAWLHAILTHPLPYLEHRLSHFWALLGGHDMVLFNSWNSGQLRFFPVRDRTYRVFETATNWLHDNTPMFRGATWLLLGVIVGVAGLRVRDERAQAAVLALSVSGVVYTLTYLVFGVAAEYRYVYWTALSSLLGGALLLVERARAHTPEA